MREKAEKKETVEKYEKMFWPITGDIKDQIWYKEYISQFAPLSYAFPDELADDFDWNLLSQLVAGSFSSDGSFDTQTAEANAENPSPEIWLPDFFIAVQSGDQHVVKKVSELRGFQILRLYEIYIEEQMNLQILIAEDENEKEAIMAQREARLSRWKLVAEQENTKALKAQDEQERAGKLDDLYNQL